MFLMWRYQTIYQWYWNFLEKMIKHLNIKIYGNVQGVFFRAAAQEQAESLGIVGFARNESDGTVYIEAEGEESALNQFLTWCHQGPPAATVEQVKVTEAQMENFSEFNI